MKKSNDKKNYRNTIRRSFILGSALMMTTGVVGCSKIVSLSASSNQKQDVQSESVQNNDSIHSPDASKKSVMDGETSTSDDETLINKEKSAGRTWHP